MTSNVLKIIAMISMFIDHAFKMGVIPDLLLFQVVGRLAFPIFAFLIAEGIYYTKNKSKYLMYMFIFAIISEVPFNLLVSNAVISLLDKNVLFTFSATISTIVVCNIIDKLKIKDDYYKIMLKIFSMIFTLILVTFLNTDYSFLGYLLVLSFYYIKIKKFNKYIFLSIALVVFCAFNYLLENYIQSYCLLCVIPLFLYNGKRGKSNKIIKFAFYSFYPIHILILYLIKFFM